MNRAVTMLFAMNIADALLTIVWVQSGVAAESNPFMDRILSAGVMPFLIFKIGIGIFAACVLLYGSNFRLARYGVAAALGLYFMTMGVHLITGLTAYGFLIY
ncbi:MAG: DUF5658 family protein [Pyrinomonadaceae bacterium]